MRKLTVFAAVCKISASRENDSASRRAATANLFGGEKIKNPPSCDGQAVTLLQYRRTTQNDTEYSGAPARNFAVPVGAPPAVV